MSAAEDCHPLANNSPPSRRPDSVSSRPPPTARAPAKPSKPLPTSASESALTRSVVEPAPPAPPAQPSRVRPFLLRGTSGAAGPARDGGKVLTRAGEVQPVKEETAELRRSRTTSALEAIAQGGTSGAKPNKTARTTAAPKVAEVCMKKPTTIRRTPAIRPLSLAGPSLRPLTPASSSLSSSRPRPLLCHDLPPTPTKDTPDSSATSPPPPSPVSTASLEAVERLKLQKKRETLLARQHQHQHHVGGGRLSGLTIRRDSPEIPATAGQGGDGLPIARSKKWFSKLTAAGVEVGGEQDGENVPPQDQGGGFTDRSTDAQRRRDRSPTPPFFASTSPNPPHSPVKRGALGPCNAAPSNLAPATPPPRLALRAPAGGKKRMYGGLGVVRVKKSREELKKNGAEQEEPDEGTDEAEEGMKHEEGYSSLQELLERHGYQDTRVITPRSKPRLVSNPSHSISGALPPPSSSGTLGPPNVSVKEKSSMLSLRGLFSLWGSSSPTEPSPPLPPLPGPQLAPEAAGVQDSPSGSNGTLTKQQRTRSSRELQEWVSGVETAMAYSSSSASSVGGPSYGATPQLDPSTRRNTVAGEVFGSPISGRSYSSSLSLSASPPTPNSLHRISNPSQPTLGVSCASPPRVSLSPYGTCAGTARQSLRHVVSESALSGQRGAGGAEAMGGYQSLTGLGIALPPSFLTESSPAYPDDASDGDDSHTPTPSTPSVHVTPPVPPPSTFAGGGWLAPTAHFFLRQRASQVFSPFGTTSSAVDAATGRTAAQRAAAAEAGGEGKNRLAAGGGAGRPRLLRKAMSSAGLVRPVTTQAVVGTKSSAESLSLSIDSLLSSSPVEGDGFGEDLLGRRW